MVSKIDLVRRKKLPQERKTKPQTNQTRKPSYRIDFTLVGGMG